MCVFSQAAKDDWDKFKEMMSSHINGILDYILRDQHSVPAMLNPLPYIKTNPNKKVTGEGSNLESLVSLLEHFKNKLYGARLVYA